MPKKSKIAKKDIEAPDMLALLEKDEKSKKKPSSDKIEESTRRKEKKDKKKSRNERIGIKMTSQDREEIEEIIRYRDETMSQFFRRALKNEVNRIKHLKKGKKEEIE